MVKEFLFPKNTYGTLVSAVLLVLRIAFAGMLITHGWQKLTHFEATTQQFASMGGASVAALVVFAEFFCALGVVVGLLYRLALIPVIITMFVAFFIAHGARLTGEGNGELSFLYLVVFVALMATGSGKYALDNYFLCKILNKKN